MKLLLTSLNGAKSQKCATILGNHSLREKPLKAPLNFFMKASPHHHHDGGGGESVFLSALSFSFIIKRR
jgi:hypothetical protein